MSSNNQANSLSTLYFRQYPYKQVMSAYPSAVVRLYCAIRAHILRQRLLAEVGQYVPQEGLVVEFGCGFGLFSLCFAMARPGIQIQACDLSGGRIQTANDVAAKLGVEHCKFHHMDARDFIDSMPGFQCAYMFDLLHHMPRGSVQGFLQQVWDKLSPGGVLIVKDVDDTPFHKMAFTYILDVLMTKGERPEYWASADLVGVLEGLGGEVRVHALDDYLPFPHRLYVVAKPA